MDRDQPAGPQEVGEGRWRGSTAGCAVIWGNPAGAKQVILAEGGDTAAAVAHALRQEIEAGDIYVAACVTAGGIEAFMRWPSTQGVIVAADRDEALGPEVNREGADAGDGYAREHAHGRANADQGARQRGHSGEEIIEAPAHEAVVLVLRGEEFQRLDV